MKIIRLDRAALNRLPPGIWALGAVSFWMDVSSEMIHALLPLYLVTGMGATMLAVGLIEGIAEATALIVKIFSGMLSDWVGRRKPLVVAGYALAALTKPVFPLAPNLGWIVGARFVDRVGKGIRGAPRDALIADLSPDALRGASFGLRQALDTAGAFVGPLIAMALMVVFAGNIPLVFWVAVLPACVSVWILLARVKEPVRLKEGGRVTFPVSRVALAQLRPAYWAVVAVAALFTLARFSEAFLILRAHDAGLAAALVPLVLVAMNLVYALSAYPAGALSDRAGRIRVLAMGMGLLVLADVVLALVPGLIGVWLGVMFWGGHMGFTQGVFQALVADAAPSELRGTAFGILNLAMGSAVLAASLVAGGLWDMAGAEATFLAGAVLAGLALMTLGLVARRFRG
jgi:MFS family permease